MERNHQKNEIIGISEISFGEVTQYPVAEASVSQLPIDWFKMAEQSMILSQLLTDSKGKINGTNL